MENGCDKCGRPFGQTPDLSALIGTAQAEIDRLRAEVESLKVYEKECRKLFGPHSTLHNAIKWQEKLLDENAALRKESCEWSYMRLNYENLRMENTKLREALEDIIQVIGPKAACKANKCEGCQYEMEEALGLAKDALHLT